MAVLSLPLSFNNSFWTPEYRKGLEVLYAKLEQGTLENDDIIAFIRARAVAEGQLALLLSKPNPIGYGGTGFGADDGASLLMAFRGLQAESVAQGAAHQAVSKELHTLVAEPFAQWAQGYKERLKQSKANVMDRLHAYELGEEEVAKLKHQYQTKTRRADEAEDDAKFAPNNGYGDKYTMSPGLSPYDSRSPPPRSASVSERIAERLKEIQRKSANALSTTANGPPKPDETVFEVTSDGDRSPTPTSTPKVDKGKGKAVDEHEPIVASPPPMSPMLPPPELTVDPGAMPPAHAPMLVAGLSMQPSAVSALLSRAKAELPLRAVRFPVLGEYQDCFHGEEFVAWLNLNVPGFGGNLDKAEEAARELTERDKLLRRIGEIGNSFEHSDEAFYQFRPKAFDLERKSSNLTSAASPSVGLSPLTDSLMKRSNTFANVVAKALVPKESEPAHIRARHEAEEADKVYRVAIRRLDRQRLSVEERIEETLKALQKWESERLKAVKTVLLQYQGTLANIPTALKAIDDRSSTLVASYQPDNDLKALIERYRTGPFHPSPHVYESVVHDDSDVVFGIDLRKWAEGGWDTLTTGDPKKDPYPNVLSALLDSLNDAYRKLPDDAEKRKSWIYEVPLASVHHLRESLNGVDPGQPVPKELLAKYDAPVIAGTVKLWLLELDPPLTLWEGWDEIRKLYPSVGSKANPNDPGQLSEQQHIQELCAALIKLPRIHLFVLDALISHFKNLIDSTPTDEDNEVYLTKLALSVGRTIIRPKSETERTLHDRHPTLLFIDLVKSYDAILPPTIAKKKRESERKVPLRKRTAPVDMRMIRGKISAGAPTRELYAAQHAAQKAPAVPALPQASPAAVPIPPTPPAVEHQPVEAPVKPKSPPPPPKPEALKAVSPSPPTPAPTSPAIPAPPTTSSDEPQPPSIKEPPPEDEDLPPRPSFKEPPSEDDYIPPPMPNFVDPPVSPPATPPPETEVVPPMPQNKPQTPVPVKRDSLINRSNSPSPGATNLRSRSPSPTNEPKASLSRSSSAQSSYVRGPRLSRGPRAPGGSNVSSMVSSMNRNSMSGSPPPAPSYKRQTANTSRPQSMVGAVAQDTRAKGISRTQALSRRTMASDAEDEVVQ